MDERLSLLNLSPKFQDALIFGAISPSQAFEISRLQDHGEQEVVFQKIKAGQLPTYNHLRRFVNAMVDAKKERFLFAVPKKEDLETVSRWEKALDAVTGLVVKSFSPDDCQVLARVLNGNSAVNLQKIDLIINHLNLIKKALLDNVSRQEVANLYDTRNPGRGYGCRFTNSNARMKIAASGAGDRRPGRCHGHLFQVRRPDAAPG